MRAIPRRVAWTLVVSLLCAGCRVKGLIYPAPAVAVPAPPAPLAEVRLDSGGEVVVAWSGEAADTAAPFVLFFHGNGENLETMRQAGLFEDVAALGVPFLAPDYPGYGASGGEPSEAANVAMAEAALAWARARHPARPVVVFGWSLGAAVAVELAARRPRDVAGLVAVAPWTALADVAAVHFPRFLVGLLLSERYDSRGAAPRVRCPALVVHGERDGIIPARQGRELAAALAAAPGADARIGTRFLEVPGAGHNDILGVPQVWREVGAFCAQVARLELSTAP